MRTLQFLQHKDHLQGQQQFYSGFETFRNVCKIAPLAQSKLKSDPLWDCEKSTITVSL